MTNGAKTTLPEELRTRLPGPNNAGLRAIVREAAANLGEYCPEALERRIAASVALTAQGRYAVRACLDAAETDAHRSQRAELPGEVAQ